MPATDETQTTAVPELTYRVDGMSCSHCEQAVSAEVGQVAGVVAIGEAGHDAVPA